nr:divergent polysaccharide deacetylase family protein [Cochlodiniinecator piscidefendens]
MFALDANAEAYENANDQPYFSILLIDDGSEAVAPDVAQNLPFPVSFIVDAAEPTAGARAAEYRAAGLEVLVMVDLPENAQPSDIEQIYQASLAAVPDAVAVIGPQSGGIGGTRQTAEQVAGILAESGHGLVTYPLGLNAAQQVATSEGVPAVTVFRELDAGNERAHIIRRYLDRAAFRAAQEGQVVMVGHLRSDTLEGLVTWGLQDRAASVAVAPISALLKAQR